MSYLPPLGGLIGQASSSLRRRPRAGVDQRLGPRPGCKLDWL